MRVRFLFFSWTVLLGPYVQCVSTDGMKKAVEDYFSDDRRHSCSVHAEDLYSAKSWLNPSTTILTKETEPHCIHITNFGQLDRKTYSFPKEYSFGFKETLPIKDARITVHPSCTVKIYYCTQEPETIKTSTSEVADGNNEDDFPSLTPVPFDAAPTCKNNMKEMVFEGKESGVYWLPDVLTPKVRGANGTTTSDSSAIPSPTDSFQFQYWVTRIQVSEQTSPVRQASTHCLYMYDANGKQYSFPPSLYSPEDYLFGGLSPTSESFLSISRVTVLPGCVAELSFASKVWDDGNLSPEAGDDSMEWWNVYLSPGEYPSLRDWISSTGIKSDVFSSVAQLGDAVMIQSIVVHAQIRIRTLGYANLLDTQRTMSLCLTMHQRSTTEQYFTLQSCTATSSQIFLYTPYSGQLRPYESMEALQRNQCITLSTKEITPTPQVTNIAATTSLALIQLHMTAMEDAPTATEDTQAATQMQPVQASEKAGSGDSSKDASSSAEVAGADAKGDGEIVRDGKAIETDEDNATKTEEKKDKTVELKTSGAVQDASLASSNNTSPAQSDTPSSKTSDSAASVAGDVQASTITPSVAETNTVDASAVVSSTPAKTDTAVTPMSPSAGSSEDESVNKEIVAPSVSTAAEALPLATSITSSGDPAPVTGNIKEGEENKETPKEKEAGMDSTGCVYTDECDYRNNRYCEPSLSTCVEKWGVKRLSETGDVDIEKLFSPALYKMNLHQIFSVSYFSGSRLLTLTIPGRKKTGLDAVSTTPILYCFTANQPPESTLQYPVKNVLVRLKICGENNAGEENSPDGSVSNMQKFVMEMAIPLDKYTAVKDSGPKIVP